MSLPFVSGNVLVGLLPSFHRRRTTLSRDETVVFYPSCAALNPDQSWTLVIQGCVFDPRVSWLRRQPVLGLIRRVMRVEHASVEPFRRRMRQFLVNGAAGRQLTIHCNGASGPVGPTDAAGLFRGELTVSSALLPLETEPSTPHVNWTTYTAEFPSDDDRTITGRVQLVPPVGISIVSDVDDTLKHSNVPDRRDLFRNTFVRDFRPIPGMPELYKQCAAAGAAFHYVSGSPWQLFEPLAEFWREQQFPQGSFHLKRFRLRETARKIRTTSPQKAHKRAAIEPLLAAYPQRRFVLIGDAGEQDPEIYSSLMRDCPDQIAHVFIRSVRGRAVDAQRIARFPFIPERFTLYEDVAEIAERLLTLVQSGGTAR